MTQTYVIDTSVLAQSFLDEDKTPHVVALLKHLFVTPEFELFVPEFCLVECTNILWKKGLYAGISFDDAEKSLKALSALPLKIADAVQCYLVP